MRDFECHEEFGLDSILCSVIYPDVGTEGFLNEDRGYDIQMKKMEEQQLNMQGEDHRRFYSKKYVECKFWDGGQGAVYSWKQSVSLCSCKL